MSETPKILKVEVEARIGMSIQTETGDWIKSDAGLTTHIGPGYPPETMLHDVAQGMVLEAYNMSSEQIQLLVSKINEKAAG